LKAERKPTRDDIARVVLHFMIVRVAKSRDKRAIDRLTDLILEALDDRGFDKDASLDAIDDLVGKYTKKLGLPL